MHKPLDSVVALAHFDLSDAQHAKAKNLLENVNNWPEWTRHVELHGLSGFVTKHVRDHDLPLPKDILTGLRALAVRHNLAAQARYQTLSDIDRIFNDNGVPYLALKGVALMPMIYGEPGLRPMRDMDLLVPASHEEQSAELIREIGFHLPQTQPNKYMKDMHQLPNATKKVNGFTVSVELHRDGYTRETDGHLSFPTQADQLQQVVWQDLKFNTFEDIKMLNQVSRHLEGLHTGAVCKLINVMDVIGLAQRVLNTGQWQRLETEYPHVITTLRCLHLHTPLPEQLQQVVAELPSKPVANVGEIMVPLSSSILSGQKPLKQRLKLLLSPSDWWLHLYYNVDPHRSLFAVKFFRHPLRVLTWLWRRLYSRLLGG